MEEGVRLVACPSGQKCHLICPTALDQMVGKSGEVSSVLCLIAIVDRQLIRRANDLADGSVECVLVEGKVCFLENMRHALECETQLCVTGLLVSYLVLVLAVIAVSDHLAMSAGIGCRSTTILTTHDERETEMMSFPLRIPKLIVIPSKADLICCKHSCLNMSDSTNTSA